MNSSNIVKFVDLNNSNNSKNYETIFDDNHSINYSVEETSDFEDTEDFDSKLKDDLSDDELIIKKKMEIHNKTKFIKN